MSDRYLAWATADGDMIPVNEMTDRHLLNCINLLRQRIARAKLATGKTSCSLLTLRYLEDEANERGIRHEST